ncbi:Mannose-6-phosphate isomerase, cupin superfamily [Microbacterium sp. cf046]|nr:Mannose-6-phosphate isomerase, cupin superfamily [Microbacterium sp. cf046]
MAGVDGIAQTEGMTLTAIDIARDENFEGYLHGSEVSIIREYASTPGTGPRLHRHPYTETFLIHAGRALFTVGAEQLVGVGGQILVVPALVAHRFEVLDGGIYEATHIHANDRFVTEWLE